MSETPAKHAVPTARCALTGAEYSRRDLVDIDTIWPGLAERIRRDHPDLPTDALISRAEVARYRNLYFRDIITAERGELTELGRQVAESLANQETVVADTERAYEARRSFGERVSDNLSSFGGSWTFIIAFGVVLVAWVGVNALWGQGAFDPFPFILLNLVLSCLAAIQAPIIMMSQKRQEAKDRIRSENDYRVNLKAELEIRHLHEKMDHLLSRQWQRLAEIQELQIEMIQETRGRR
ncbi:DUF1003 domain-containing protein [Prosthecomicrobium sp. N25]|uniref:DUF1003 domain-containing protein n=1 Tax=Prosthecomicrobium sp. N25 TaxID=3129254 RepID=UPI00307760DF